MLDDLFDEIAAEGWRVANLYQTREGWRVNLQRPDGEGLWATDWAEEPTLAEALGTAIAKTAQAEFLAAAPQSYSLDTRSALEAIAARLGLKPRPTVRRRI